MAQVRDAEVRLLRPIVLVGMMGAGKTSVGRRLAGLLRVPFRDCDLEIEAAAGLTIPELFERFGEPAFRAGERRVVARLLGEAPGVLATGGGAFIDPDTRAVIREAATSVWLRAELETLWARVRGRPGRPLLACPDPKAALIEIEARRRPIYAEADVIVDSPAGISQDAMARAIVKAVAARDAAAGAPATLQRVTQ